MQDFSLDNKEANIKSADASSELQMQVSQICNKDGKKIAYVTFSDGVRRAEGQIPECVVIKNDGFNKAEILQLEDYMEKELPTLKKMASSVNLLDAFMKK